MIHQGDCIEVMATLEADSIDAIVTDPPYGIEFMGKAWDAFAPSDPVLRSGWDSAGLSGSGITDIADVDATQAASGSRVAFGKRRGTFRCTACGKRDGFRNEHPCGDHWVAEWVDARPLEALAFGEWCRTWALEAYRIAKPGAHLLAFGGTRTHHRLMAGLEDAGWEIRDCLVWAYASGFPKSLDVGKAIDKAAGATREVVGTVPDRWAGTGHLLNRNGRDVVNGSARIGGEAPITAPATDDARAWDGWGTIDANATRQRGMPGAKPDGMCWWMFAAAGLRPDDEFVDLYPGSGAVSRAWDAWRRQLPLTLGATGRQRRKAQATAGLET